MPEAAPERNPVRHTCSALPRTARYRLFPAPIHLSARSSPLYTTPISHARSPLLFNPLVLLSSTAPHTPTHTPHTAMYEELTILGFVGLIFFSLQKADVFVDLSEHIFGEDAESKEVLPELAENVHMVLFAVMVVRLDQALGYRVSRRGGAEGCVCVCEGMVCGGG